MTFQHKPNTGSLFVNDKRENDKHPNVKGSAIIDGKEYWVAAWTNEGTKGKYQSLKFELKENQGKSPSSGGQQSQPAPAPSGDDSWDDDIPF